MEDASPSLSAEQKPREDGMLCFTPDQSRLSACLRAGAKKAGVPEDFECILSAALKVAVADGDKSSVLALLGLGVIFDDALNLAVEHGHKEIATALLESGAPANGCVDAEETPLYAAATQGNTEMLALLLEKKADMDFFDYGFECKQEGTALFGATKQGHLPAVQLLLTAGADSSIRSRCRKSPLENTVHRGDEAVLETLLAFGADANDANDYGMTPLHSAQSEIAVDKLVDAGADIEARCKGGATPLMCALGAFFSYEAALVLVLNHGAADNCQDNHGDTPLHYNTPQSLGPKTSLTSC